MPIVNRIADFHADMTAWRRDLHAHPELGFQEHRTSAIVAEKLRAFGCDGVHVGLAGTGVVATIRGSAPGPAIGLRADMDALPIEEATGLDYASTAPGRMHACGHDGHTAMLLGAARYLAETRRFAGTVQLIFQPAEENGGGGGVMVREGLFDRFPVERVFGLHNWPGAPAGVFLSRPGPIMAAVANLEAIVRGQGSHGAMPHEGRDPIVAAAALVGALQTVVARNVEPAEAGVVTIGHLQGGDTFNVIPSSVLLRGTARWFAPAVGDLLERRFGEIAHGIAAAYGCTAELRFERLYPATVNEPESEALAMAAARAVAGDARAIPMPRPTMGGEDFSFMLAARPGSYIMLGSGRGERDPSLHNPRYDFNDEVLPIGASWWATLVEQQLPLRP